MATGFNTQVGNGEYRLQFETDNKEHYLLMQEAARRCVDGKSKTNADRIRTMSDENLAWELMLWRCEAIAKYHGIESQYPDTHSKILDWLQKPAEGGLTMRLIDSTKLIDALPVVAEDKKISLIGAVADMVMLISEQPVIEAEPVRHGYWENANGRPKTYIRKCSVCGKEAYFCGRGCSYKFCPNCGSKMEGESDE